MAREENVALWRKLIAKVGNIEVPDRDHRQILRRHVDLEKASSSHLTCGYTAATVTT